jgi:hypothetical protein
MVIMVFLAVCLVVFASMMYWISTGSTVTARNNQFNMSEAAAEAAVEKVLSQMNYDYVAQLGLAHPICLQRHKRRHDEPADQRRLRRMDQQHGASELAIRGVVWFGAGLHHHRHRHAGWPAVQRAGHRQRDNSIRLHPPLSIRHIL